ncbi:MAG: hypothetical protein ACM3ON_08075 [Chloroflexota bacterium]
MKGKLNIFQKTMLRWSDLHPYNAVHVATVPEPLDLPRLEYVVNGVLQDCGLNSLSLDRAKGAYHYGGGPFHYGVRATGTGRHDGPLIEREVEAELNSPFTQGEQVCPMRFLAVDCGGHFHLGLVYSHFVSGADSIVSLLKTIITAYRERKTAPFGVALDLYPPRYGLLLRRAFRHFPGWLASLSASVRAIRCSHRPRYSATGDYTNGFSLFSLDPECLINLLRVSRQWGVTLNDIFLAVLLKTVAPFAEARFRSRRRRQISVASIANVREDLGISRERTFGLFLGFLTVSHPVHEGMHLKDIVLDVHAQTEWIKRHKLYLRSPLDLGVARFLMRSFAPGGQRNFYQKYYPLWGGITNVNLNTLWEQTAGEESVDYVRAVSTGPVCPLVASITTVGDRINIGLSFRTAAFAGDDIRRIASAFSRELECLEDR